jgi:hypothetical protein
MPWPSWAWWSEGAGRCYTVGVEEEVMLLDPSDYSLSESGDGVLGRLSDELAAHMRPETHAAVIELATGIHVQVAAAVAELAALRSRWPESCASWASGSRRRACIHWRRRGRPGCPVQSATGWWLIRCARWLTGSLRWPCTCTWGSWTPRTRSGCSTACGLRCRCCLRCRRTRRFRGGGIPGSLRPER